MYKFKVGDFVSSAGELSSRLKVTSAFQEVVYTHVAEGQKVNRYAATDGKVYREDDLVPYNKATAILASKIEELEDRLNEPQNPRSYTDAFNNSYISGRKALTSKNINKLMKRAIKQLQNYGK